VLVISTLSSQALENLKVDPQKKLQVGWPMVMAGIADGEGLLDSDPSQKWGGEN